LKYTINALNYIEIYYQYNEVHPNALKNIQILWCLLKYIYSPLKTHSYILVYIKIPSKYIAIPSLHIFGYVRIPLIYSNMLSYMLKLSWNLPIPHLFVLSLPYFSKLSWRLIILLKCHYTCHDMFIVIQKWSIFYKSHECYWLIKYLNPKLISWDSINTCWTYIRWSQNP
jgi:hypothetical protein